MRKKRQENKLRSSVAAHCDVRRNERRTANNINIKSETAAAMRTKNVNDDAQQWGERVGTVVVYELCVVLEMYTFSEPKPEQSSKVISQLQPQSQLKHRPGPKETEKKNNE